MNKPNRPTERQVIGYSAPLVLRGIGQVMIVQRISCAVGERFEDSFRVVWGCCLIMTGRVVIGAWTSSVPITQMVDLSWVVVVRERMEARMERRLVVLLTFNQWVVDMLVMEVESRRVAMRGMGGAIGVVVGLMVFGTFLL